MILLPCCISCIGFYKIFLVACVALATSDRLCCNHFPSGIPTDHIAFQYLCKKEGLSSQLANVVSGSIDSIWCRCRLRWLRRPLFHLPGKSAEVINETLGM